MVDLESEIKIVKTYPAKLRKVITGLLILVILACAIWIPYKIWLNFQPFNRGIYEELLRELNAQNYTVVLPRAYFFNGSPHEKTALIYHDVDFSFEGVYLFEELERAFHVRSALYIRPTSDYFLQNIAYLQQLEAEGWEIGFHYETLSRSHNNLALAQEIFRAQLSFMRSLFSIETVRAHGDKYNFSTYNFLIDQDGFFLELNVREAGDQKIHFTDTNKVLSFPAFEGDLISINLHSDYWS